MRGMRTTSSGNGRVAKGSARKGRKAGKGRSRITRKAAEQTGTSTFDKTPRKLTITVAVPTPSPNEWVWTHWSKYREIKKAWESRMYYAAYQHVGLGKFGPPVHNASLTIERVGIKLLDEDNLKGGVKPVIDTLIKLGFLENDTPDVIQHMDVFQTQVRTKAEQQTRIALIEQAG